MTTAIANNDPVVIKPLPTRDLMERLKSPMSVYEIDRTVREWVSELKSERGEGCWLTLRDFARVCRPDAAGGFAKVVVEPSLLDENNDSSSVIQSLRELEGYIGQRRRIYGVNTGYGSFRRHELPPESASLLSANVLLSHATGVGDPLPVEIVRGMMLLRVKTFCQGFSAVRPHSIATLTGALNVGIVPYIPEKGSVGASGDLAPLSHLFLVMTGRGRAWVLSDPKQWAEERLERFYRGEDESRALWRDGNQNVLLSGVDAWKAAGLQPLNIDGLAPKEGLAFTNGAALSAAALALALTDAEYLYHTANICGAMSLQAVSGHTRAMELAVQAARPHPGQVVTGLEMLRLLEGSTFVNRAAYEYDAQDDYCLRAIPQVHGAAWNAIVHVREIAETEINSATDNPLFFKHLVGDRDGFLHRVKGERFAEADPFDGFTRILDTAHCSAANFHGEPVAAALDYLKIAVAELAGISERRVQMLLDPHHNRGLPANLTLGQSGLHSGFMLFQYTAAALAAENKVLCHPSSVDSIPTSANAEDYVSMATNAARHLRVVLRNAADILAIELICACQALDIRSTYLRGWLSRMMRECDESEVHEFVIGTDSRRRQARVRRFKMLLNFRSLDDLKGKDADGVELQALELGEAADRVHRFLRHDIAVPFVMHDGYTGSDDRKDGVTGDASFGSHPPSDLIAGASKAVRLGLVVRAAEA